MSMLADAEPIVIDPDEIRADTVRANVIRCGDWRPTEARMLALLDDIEDMLRAESVEVSLSCQAWADLDACRCALTERVREAAA